MEETGGGLCGPVVYVPRRRSPLPLPHPFLQVVVLQNSVVMGFLAQIPGELSFSLPSASEAMMLVSKSFSIINIGFFHFLSAADFRQRVSEGKVSCVC